MQLSDNRYHLTNGVDPLALVEKYGTPLYVYDTAIIERQYKRLAGSFSVPKLHINYACKANTNINILKLLKKLGAGLDAVSIQEVELGIMAGFAPQDITYTPNSVALDEINTALKFGVKINIDNISILEQFGMEHPEISVGIRINPHIMAGGNSKISTGHIDSKFGISIHQLPHVLKVIETTGTKIDGLHMHTGSDILDANAFLLAADILLNVASNFKYLEYIDFGSGFKVPYKDEDIETDIEEVGERISERFTQFCKDYGRDLTLVFEPGKFLVSQAGYFFVRSTVVKPTPSTVFIGVDSGLNHLIRPMMYGSYHRIENISYPQGKPRFYTVVGNICETDTFGSNRKIASVEEGDVLCLFNAGAYGFSMASNYNSRFRPAEVMVHEGKDYLIRQRETMQDILRNQVEVKFEEKLVKAG
ncbi:MAG: diaminopimelate decarboxylase [Saprospiraceae bacterium]|nr:diaminopimelate decarboxylase [Saprospiraceae bacterium]